MKLDYNLIKQILLTMAECDTHEIRSKTLMQAIGVLDSKNIINEQLLDVFVGHIKILGDKNLIECSDKTNKFGFAKGLNDNYTISNPNFRITAQGYEFLDILKNDNVFNKIKNFAISNAIEIGKQLLIKYAINHVLS